MQFELQFSLQFWGAPVSQVAVRRSIVPQVWSTTSSIKKIMAKSILVIKSLLCLATLATLAIAKHVADDGLVLVRDFS